MPEPRKSKDWLGSRRTEVAADRILDAAERLYTEHDQASIGMNEIARAAGCSRATLYRYFENREALRTAYVHRETRRLSRAIKEQITGIDQPRERLIASIIATLQMVRSSPALASWFAVTRPPIAGELAEQSDVIAALAVAPLALGDHGWYSKLLATRPMVWLGEISYEIFLIHLVTMEFAMVYVVRAHVYTGSMPNLFLATMVLTIPLAWLLHRFTRVRD